jgi:hypothetical protein
MNKRMMKNNNHSRINNHLYIELKEINKLKEILFQDLYLKIISILTYYYNRMKKNIQRRQQVKSL